MYTLPVYDSLARYAISYPDPRNHGNKRDSAHKQTSLEEAPQFGGVA